MFWTVGYVRLMHRRLICLAKYISCVLFRFHFPSLHPLRILFHFPFLIFHYFLVSLCITNFSFLFLSHFFIMIIFPSNE